MRPFRWSSLAGGSEDIDEIGSAYETSHRHNIMRAHSRDDEALVTIAEFQTVFDAGIARGALEAIGIPALVPEEVMTRTGSGTIGHLQVFESDAERAKVELRRMQIRLIGEEG